MKRAPEQWPAALVFITAAGAAACDAAPAAIDDAVVVATRAAHSPTVALAPDGSALVAWVSGDSVYDVLLARAGAAPVRVNDIPGDAAPHTQAPAQVAVGPEGNVYVAWQNNTPVAGRRFPASDLRFARSIDGGRSFQPAIYVNDDAGGPPASHTFHDVAVADDGTVFVSWIDGRDRAQTRVDGMAAGAPETAGHAMDSHAHDMAAGMPADTDAGPAIRVARSTDGGRSFSAGVVVTPTACPCCRTAVAVRDRDVYVAWRDVTGGNVRNVVVAHSADAGESWSLPSPVHDDAWRIDGCPHAGPSLAIADDGRLHVAWYTGAPDRPGIHHAVADRDLRFGPPAPLLTGEWVPPSLVDLAAAGSTILAAWDDRRTGVPQLTFGTADGRARAAGLMPDRRGRAQTAGMAPALAVRGNRYALAWLRGDSVLVRTGVSR